jgi:phage terminase large subunit-like protein
MDWQAQVADVGFEYNPVTGVPAYREVIVTVPRQCGKTTLVFCVEIDRALGYLTPQRVAYSAQTGQDARRKLLDDQVPTLEWSGQFPKALIRKVIRTNGAEAIEFGNGSRLEIMAGDKGAGHGRTLDLGVIDEAFDDTDDRREGAMLPAMRTRANAQILIVSTAGTHESTYLRRKIEQGRRAAQDGVTEGIAYFEWSVPESEGADDEDAWYRYIPALNDTGVAAMRHARRAMAEGEFRRAFLNQWTAAEQLWMTQELWDVCDPAPDLPVGSAGVVIGVDVGIRHDSTAVVTARRDDAGIYHAVAKVWTPDEAKDERLDLGIVEQFIRDEITKYPGAKVAYDPHFFERSAQVLADEGIEMVEWGQSNALMCPATQTLYEAVANNRLRHGGDETLRRHALNAATRMTERGIRVAKLPSKEHIDALVALMMAVELLGRQREPRRSVYETRGVFTV